MLTEAIMDAVGKTEANNGRFGELFPHVSERDAYELNPNTQWTAGFWPASAIAAAGMLELIEHLDSSHPQYDFFRGAVGRSMDSLVMNYSTKDDPGAQGFIKHGSYSVRGNAAPDGFMIWGDYFYLEALMRMEKKRSGYWYESGYGGYVGL